jgi:hypothetical protein
VDRLHKALEDTGIKLDCVATDNPRQVRPGDARRAAVRDDRSGFIQRDKPSDNVTKHYYKGAPTGDYGRPHCSNSAAMLRLPDLIRAAV